MRASLLLGVVLLGFGSAVLAREAEREINFDIPQQPVHAALVEFAEQADLTLVFPDDVVGDKFANDLIGRYGLQEGAEILLAGTGLAPTFSDQIVLSISVDNQWTNEGNTMNEKALLGKRLVTAIAATILTTFGAASEASEAGDANAEKTSAIEEIVVTASKREESLMEVAQSIQYLSGEELEGSGVQYLDQIVQLIPGVSLAAGGPANRRYNARGTGASSTTNDSAIGFYIDGMPYYIVDLPLGPDAEVFDLESIQVLRGPQGTLYGQGAMGGTILITTAQPDLEQFSRSGTCRRFAHARRRRRPYLRCQHQCTAD